MLPLLVPAGYPVCAQKGKKRGNMKETISLITAYSVYGYRESDTIRKHLEKRRF